MIKLCHFKKFFKNTRKSIVLGVFIILILNIHLSTRLCFSYVPMDIDFSSKDKTAEEGSEKQIKTSNDKKPESKKDTKKWSTKKKTFVWGGTGIAGAAALIAAASSGGGDGGDESSPITPPSKNPTPPYKCFTIRYTNPYPSTYSFKYEYQYYGTQKYTEEKPIRTGYSDSFVFCADIGSTYCLLGKINDTWYYVGDPHTVN